MFQRKSSVSGRLVWRVCMSALEEKKRSRKAMTGAYRGNKNRDEGVAVEDGEQMACLTGIMKDEIYFFIQQIFIEYLTVYIPATSI